MLSRLLAAAAMLSFLSSSALSTAEAQVTQVDVCVYGGTSAGVIAAVQAKKMGKTVVVVGPDKHLGGLSAGGLGFTDTGNKAVIGGLSRDFYHRIWKHYQEDAAWKWQKKDQYGNKGQGTAAIDGEQRTMWIFEPHAAERVFEDYVREFEIPVHRNEYLDRKNGVVKEGEKIVSITMLSGKKYAAKMFLDATYEGDLMAAAGVKYHVGREAVKTYDEKWNGVQVGVLHHGHHFGAVKQKISPYITPGDPKSGVLPRVSVDPPGEYGSEDRRVQAYCFRMCLTNHEENRIPFAKPAGYDPKQYELLARVFAAGWREHFGKFDPIPNHKTDTNNHGPFSFDNIGMNYDYPEADYERRKEIIAEHERYQKGLLYFTANDPSVPEDVRKAMSKWGLPKDEFIDNRNWSHQLYIREARRMVGKYVMTEKELVGRRPTPESVGMGSYTIDSHNVQRYITPEGFVQNEGDIGVGTNGPYEIAYGSLVPQAGQANNLLVPVCVSSSHIAFGSIRMEPVFMILGQSAATAAVMAIEDNIPVQAVPYEKLRERLLADGQILTYGNGKKVPGGQGESHGMSAEKLEGIVVDDSAAELKGAWEQSRVNGPFVGEGYRHDSKGAVGSLSAVYKAKLPKSGKYEVRMSYPKNENRATNVSVEIVSAGEKVTKVAVDETKQPKLDGAFISLGTFEFNAASGGQVTISNTGANGFVVIDAVQWVMK